MKIKAYSLYDSDVKAFSGRIIDAMFFGCSFPFSPAQAAFAALNSGVGGGEGTGRGGVPRAETGERAAKEEEGEGSSTPETCRLWPRLRADPARSS